MMEILTITDDATSEDRHLLTVLQNTGAIKYTTRMASGLEIETHDCFQCRSTTMECRAREDPHSDIEYTLNRFSDRMTIEGVPPGRYALIRLD